jgi:hypothetical protein
MNRDSELSLPQTIARVSYALTVSVCGVAASLVGWRFTASLIRELPQTRIRLSDVAFIALVAAFVVPSYRAIIRKLRGRPLLVEAGETDLRIYTWAAAVLGALAHVIVAWLAWLIFTSKPEQPDEISMAAGPLIIAGIFYLMGLWIGEFVLMRSAGHGTTGHVSS